MSELRLYNTLTRSRDRFESRQPGRVHVYTCGPTVYSHAHLGNMRAYLFSDLLKRSLRYFGYDVLHVINITDVGHLTDDADAGEDKMELAARQSGASAWDVAEKWTGVFQRDLARLRVLEPDVWCRATDHIAEQIEMIAQLDAKGFVYRIDDGLYFDVSKDPTYGELARIELDAQQAQERVEGTEKRNPADFALWKFSPSEGPRRQMEWDSPWGVGFPGWHIECSAMSTRYLGEQFDIHTGGIDHVPVHHPNEIAQSETALGVRPWVRFWMHSGWLMFGDQKMSKSSGGAPTLDDLVASGIDPGVFRFFALSAHYRQQAQFSDEALESAQAGHARLLRRAAELRVAADGEPGVAGRAYSKRFRDALADDLNAPRALAVAWEVVRSAELGDADKAQLLAEFDEVLGLGLAEAELPVSESDERIDALVRERDEARKTRDWARADAIRDELAQEGIVLEDSPDGTRWHHG